MISNTLSRFNINIKTFADSSENKNHNILYNNIDLNAFKNFTFNNFVIVSDSLPAIYYIILVKIAG